MAPKRGGGVAGRGRGPSVVRPHTSFFARWTSWGCVGAFLFFCGGGFWRYDFLLCVLSRTATQIPLPFSFPSMISELNLGGLWLPLQGCARSPSWVELIVDSSCLIFLGSGWRTFSRRLNL